VGDPMFLAVAVIVLVGLPWLATGALLAMRRKLAFWPLVFPFSLAILMWVIGVRADDYLFPSVALGYTLAMLVIVFCLRKRRALT
jgi:hypothetical protein